MVSSLALANDDSWKTAASGAWSVGSNWLDGTTPGNSDKLEANLIRAALAAFDRFRGTKYAVKTCCFSSCVAVAVRRVGAAPGLAVCKVLLLVFAMSAAPAQATLMTFGDGAPLESDGYTEGGLAISVTSVVLMPIRDWQSFTEIGEREVLDTDGASYDFSLVSGGMFDLLSIDVEDPDGLPRAKFGTVDVMGSNGSTVTLDAQVVGTQSFGTIFLGISSFHIQYAPSSQLTFDNINFRVIPEPRTLALIGASFPGLIYLRRGTK